MIAQQLAFVVQPFQLSSQDARRGRIRGGQQFNSLGGVRKTAQRVEPRAKLKADCLGIHAQGVEIGLRHERLQAEARRLAQLQQAALQQVARIAYLPRHVSHDPQRDQV